MFKLAYADDFGKTYMDENGRMVDIMNGAKWTSRDVYRVHFTLGGVDFCLSAYSPAELIALNNDVLAFIAANHVRAVYTDERFIVVTPNNPNDNDYVYVSDYRFRNP